ncbi:MAG TPA: transposase [Tepidisphaeraceae bacterium]|jgi:putative transposase
MPNYRRAWRPGGTFFLTLVTHQRRPLLADAFAHKALHRAIALTRQDRPFDLIAAVLLPDHVHLVIALPPGDADLPTRVGAIKGRFSRAWLKAGRPTSGQSASRTRQQYAALWQKRYWEHSVRDENALIACCDYVHYNPVKHSHAACPHGWPWSTFHRHVRSCHYPADWLCVCNGRPAPPKPPAFNEANDDV